MLANPLRLVFFFRFLASFPSLLFPVLSLMSSLHFFSRNSLLSCSSLSLRGPLHFFSFLAFVSILSYSSLSSLAPVLFWFLFVNWSSPVRRGRLVVLSFFFSLSGPHLFVVVVSCSCLVFRFFPHLLVVFVVVVSWSCLPFFSSFVGLLLVVLIASWSCFFFLIFSFNPTVFGLVVFCSCILFLFS